LGMDEVPTAWEPIEDILWQRNIIREPINKSEFKKIKIGRNNSEIDVPRAVIDQDAVNIMRDFMFTHTYDKKYQEVEKIISDLFWGKWVDGKRQEPNAFTYNKSPKLIAAPVTYNAYRILGANAQTPWEEIVTQYEKLLDQNDPTYESDPMKRHEKEEVFEEVLRAFKILETDHAERVQQKFQELEQQEQQRYREEL